MVENTNATNKMTPGTISRSKLSQEQTNLLENYLLSTSRSVSKERSNERLNSNIPRSKTRIFNNAVEVSPEPRNSSNFYSTRSSQRYLKFFDKNKDGKVSDDEAIDYVLQYSAQKTNTPKALFALNQNTNDFDKVTKAFDKATKDGVFSNQELTQALLALKTPQFSNINYQNAIKILKRNTQFEEIKTIVDFIDANSNGIISDIEVLDTVLAAKKGLISLNHQSAQEILKTNPNFDKIINFLQNTNGDFNGEVSDKDVFNILISLRTGNLSEDQALMSLFLSKNSNREAISNSINILDKDNNGTISNTEFGDFILDLRNGKINKEQNEIVKNILENDNNFKNLLDVINAIDKDKNGQVSDEEIIDFSLAVRKGLINLDSDLTKLILGKNQNLSALVGLIGLIDKNNDGDIQSNEVYNTIIALNKGELREQDAQLINKIISTNPRKEQIQNAINFVDINKDGTTEDQEILKAEILFRKGQATNIDQISLRTVFESNPNYRAVLDTLNLFDPDENGLLSQNDFINKILDKRKGLIAVPDDRIYDIIVENFDKEHQVLTALNIFDEDKNGVIEDKSFAKGLLAIRAGLIKANSELISTLASNNENSQIIQDAISTMDSDNNGIVSADEFNNNFKASVSINGIVDFKRMSIVSNILDVIYPDAVKLDKFRDDLDQNNDQQLSDMELIDGLLNLRNGSITNPGIDIIRVVISANQNFKNIIETIDQIDLDKDGIISDSDILKGLIGVRKGNFSNEQLPFVQAILMKNQNYNQIQSALNLFDPDFNGDISNWELINAIFKIRRNEINFLIDVQILDALKSLNPNKNKVEQLLKTIDPDVSGTIDYSELINGVLGINLGILDRPENSVLIRLPNSSGQAYGDSILSAELLINKIDQNKNGEISDNEIASLILSDKANGELLGFDPDFVSAIFATNPRSTDIKNLIEQIDKDDDGIFSDKEIIDAVLAQKNGTLRASSNGLLDMILSNNSEYSKIKNLLEQVDKDNNGNISDTNLVTALFEFKAPNQNPLDARALEILDLILDTNHSKPYLENSYDILALSSNGDKVKMKNTLLELRSAEVDFPEIQNLVNPASELINSWDAQVKSVYSQKVTELLTSIQSHSINKNLSSLGIASLVGFITELNNIKSDLSNGKKSSFNKLHNLINNFQTTVNSTPNSSPDIVSGIFYEDFKTNLNTVKTFLDTGVVNGYESRFQEIANLALRFDKDQDGRFSDQEVINGILDIKTNKISISNPQYLELIFNSNSNFKAINDFINNSDKDTNGSISKTEFLNLYSSTIQSSNTINKNILNLMGQYEDYQASFRTIKAFDIYGNAQFKDSDILQGLLYTRANQNLSFDSEIMNSIFATNPDSIGIQKLVNIIDPDANGVYHNINDVLNHSISIWQGKVARNNLAYDFNGDGITDNKDASILFDLHMNVNNLIKFNIPN